MPNKEKLSHSEKIHRRRVLAKERSSVDFLQKQISSYEQAEERLKEINVTLQNDSLDPFQRAIYSIEKLWAGEKLGKVKSSARESGIAQIYNDLEEKNPEASAKLKKKDEYGRTIAFFIREKYFPTTIKGYHTKKGF